MLLLLAVAGPVLLLVIVAWYSYQAAFHQTGADLARLTEIMQQQVADDIDIQQLVAQRVDDAIRGVDDSTIARSEAALHHALAVIIAGSPQVEAVQITDASGRPLASSELYPVATSAGMADRSYLDVLQRSSDRIHVGRISSSAAFSAPRLGLAYRREAQDHSFAGAIDVLAPADFLSRFCQRLIDEDSLGPNGFALALLRSDGTVLLRYPPAPVSLLRLPSGSPFFAAIADAPQGGNYVGHSVALPDALTQHYVYRVVPGRRLYVMASRTTASVITAWLHELLASMALTVAAMIVLVAITLAALRRTQSEQIARTQAHMEMEKREAAESTLHHMQKLEAVGQLTAGIAHDFNNLLTVILGNLEFLGRSLPDDPSVPRRMEQMHDAASRGARLTAQLLTFSRRQRLSPQPVDLNAILGSMQEMLRSTLGGTVRTEMVLRPELWLAMADRAQLELAILNIAINARDAMPSTGKLVIATANATLAAPTEAQEPPPGDYVSVSIEDTGAGMTRDVLARAFEPFFTTKPQGEASGLGLSQVHAFAQQSGGAVTVRSTPGKGTTVTLFLPRAAVGSVPQARPTRVEKVVGGDGVVLLVDDDADVRSVTGAMLSRLGYTILQADGGASALEQVRKDPSIQVAVIDYAMPDMNGIELARRLRDIHSPLPVLFITGYADAATMAPRESGDLLLQKPFTVGDLAARLTALLSVRRLINTDDQSPSG